MKLFLEKLLDILEALLRFRRRKAKRWEIHKPTSSLKTRESPFI